MMKGLKDIRMRVRTEPSAFKADVKSAGLDAGKLKKLQKPFKG